MLIVKHDIGMTDIGIGVGIMESMKITGTKHLAILVIGIRGIQLGLHGMNVQLFLVIKAMKAKEIPVF